MVWAPPARLRRAQDEHTRGGACENPGGVVVTIKTQPGATRQWLRHTLHCFLLVLVASTVMQSRYDMDLAAWGLGVQDYGQPHGWGIPHHS